MSNEENMSEKTDKLSDSETVKYSLNRRKFFKLGAGLAVIPTLGLIGCNSGSSGSSSSNEEVSGGETPSTGGGQGGGEPPAGGGPGEPPTGGGQGGGGAAAEYCEYSVNTSDWATGGVASLAASFPATSIFDRASTCAVTMSNTTLGPCFFAVETGEDISFEKDGIPMQVCLQIVDSNCTPLSDAQVEIWHCDRAGVYSADTSGSSESGQFAGNFCSGGDEAANNAKWFRGVLNTDGEGRVNFKTCFPGWYASRTCHIHFRVKQGDQVSIISQFCFEDTLTEEIYTKHPAYSCRGSQDTPLSSGDNVFGSMYQNYLMNVEKNTDKSMLAYKRVMLT